MLRTVCDQFLDLAELMAQHVEKVDSRFVKKAAGNVDVAGPCGILQLAAVHLDVGRMRSVAREQLFQFHVHRSITSVMTDLKDNLAGISGIKQLLGSRDTD